MVVAEGETVTPVEVSQSRVAGSGRAGETNKGADFLTDSQISHCRRATHQSVKWPVAWPPPCNARSSRDPLRN